MHWSRLKRTEGYRNRTMEQADADAMRTRSDSTISPTTEHKARVRNVAFPRWFAVVAVVRWHFAVVAKMTMVLRHPPLR
jgi:hypothetical protein